MSASIVESNLFRTEAVKLRASPSLLVTELVTLKRNLRFSGQSEDSRSGL
jgi:hypothetical protein